MTEILYLSIGIILGISLRDKRLPVEDMPKIKLKCEKAKFFEPISDQEKVENIFKN